MAHELTLPESSGVWHCPYCEQRFCTPITCFEQVKRLTQGGDTMTSSDPKNKAEEQQEAQVEVKAEEASKQAQEEARARAQEEARQAMINGV